MLIYVDETDQWGDVPLYEAIVRKLHQAGLAGATVQMGVMGFGSHARVHAKQLFGLSDDRPVIIHVCDEEARIRAALPDIGGMVQEGLVLLLDAERIR
jgi:PII-like signaling protein